MITKFPKGQKAAELARQTAEKQHAYYGCSVFGGDWYAGDTDDLDRIGVPIPIPCRAIMIEDEESKDLP